MAENKQVKSSKKPMRAEVKAKPKSLPSVSKDKTRSSKTKVAPVNSTSSLLSSHKFFFKLNVALMMNCC